MRKRLVLLLLASMIAISSLCFSSFASNKRFGYSDVELYYVKDFCPLLIPAYTVDGDLAICVEDLRAYGYDMKWEAKKRKTRFSPAESFCLFAENGEIGRVSYEGTDKRTISKDASIVYSDVKIYIGGKFISSYNTDGYSLVKVDDLNRLTNEVMVMRYRPLEEGAKEDLYPVAFPVTGRYGFINKDFELVVRPDYFVRSSRGEFTGGDIVQNLPAVIPSSEVENYIENIDGDSCLRMNIPEYESHNLSEKMIQKFNFISRFKDGVALVQKGGRNQIPFCPGGGSAWIRHRDIKNYPMEDGTYGYIDTDGNYVIKPAFKNAFQFSEGLAVVSNFENKYGVINRKGEIIIPFQYFFINSYQNGYALVENHVENSNNYEYFFIDRNGNKIFGRSFIDATSFDKGLASVKTENGLGLIDTGGNFVKEPRKDAIGYAKDLTIVEREYTSTYADGSIYTGTHRFYENDEGLYYDYMRPTFGAIMNNSIYGWY